MRPAAIHPHAWGISRSFVKALKRQKIALFVPDGHIQDIFRLVEFKTQTSIKIDDAFIQRLHHQRINASKAAHFNGGFESELNQSAAKPLMLMMDIYSQTSQ